ncbi:MAG: glycosidase [Dehalococcoidia bacterium]|nr:glycosidase [Dehalococcoidia bacterium]
MPNPLDKIISRNQMEERFRQAISDSLEQARQTGAADIVVGIPFYNEADSIGHVLRAAIKGLDQYYPNAKSVIVAVGSPAGGTALQAIKSIHRTKKSNVERIAFTFDDDTVDGKGWSIRGIMEIADQLGGDLVLLEADLVSRKSKEEVAGMTPEWIQLLLDPIRRGQMDLVVSRFNMHYLDIIAHTNLTHPLLSSVYNCPVYSLVGGLRGIAHPLLRVYRDEARRSWSTTVGGHGIDAWIVTNAIINNARIGEANLGVKIHQQSGGKRELVFRQVTRALFDQIRKDQDWWQSTQTTDEPPILKRLPVIGIRKPHRPVTAEMAPDVLMAKYKAGFNQFHSLYEKIFPVDIYRQLENMAEVQSEKFNFSPGAWAKVLYDLLLAYAFNRDFAQDDLFDSLIPLYDGFTASNLIEIETLRTELESIAPEKADHLISIESEARIEALVDEVLVQKPIFMAAWQEKSEALKPSVPQVTYREFIPGVALVVPSQMRALDGGIVTANGVYESVFARRRQEFERFVYQRLEVQRGAGSQETSLAIKQFLLSVENRLFPEADLSTIEGTQQAVDAIFAEFPHQKAFSLVPEMVSVILAQTPPMVLLIKLGFDTLDKLLQKYDSRDVLALVSWVEDRDYVESLWGVIRENIRPEHFGPCDIKPLVVKGDDFPSLVEMKDSSALDKLGSGILVTSLHKGMGGEFPKLRYLTTIAKNIIEAEMFGQVWQRFASERKDFGRKVIESIEGHWGRKPLSAHSIFEAAIHQSLAARLRQMAEAIAASGEGNKDRLALADGLRSVADSYALALTLPDGGFVTCSAWSWASYSFRGGRTSPSPLSAHVETDWASREFLSEYFKAVGGTADDLEEEIVELMGQGRAWEDLAQRMLGTEKEAGTIMPRGIAGLTEGQPLAGMLTRYAHNPVLEPVNDHPWESKYVLNAGTIRLDGKVYLVYRAFGEDKISRLGLAVSKDGFKFEHRPDHPIFEPEGKDDAQGCEDPRLTRMGDRIYMTYTAYDGMIAQIAMASIPVDDFLREHWQSWQRHGMVFPGITDKDAALFPEQFNGKFAMLHRVDPHIWVTFSPHLRCPWPRRMHEILAGATSGMMWDATKIGGGSQPIKTRFGWLLITHGVDYAHIYRLGVMLLDLTNPAKLLYRSPNFVLQPEEKWELGKDEQSWVPHVVFTCGAVPAGEEKEILDAEDELIVYYGAADSVICAATATIGDLIPEKFR